MNAQLTVETHSYAVTAYLRQPVVLAPFDSLHRVIDILRFGGIEAVPVLDETGILLGVVDSACLAGALDWSSSQAPLSNPVTEVMRQPKSLITYNMNASQISKVLRASGEACLPVIDGRGRYIGMVSVTDLLMPMPIRARPPRVGGMATPWGVYLTTGSIQAGVGNGALVGSGVLMGAMLAAACGVVALGCMFLQHEFDLPVFSAFSTLLTGVDSQHIAVGNYSWLLQFLIIPVFLMMLRSMPLAGYHAAEHQAVHAMERGEELLPDIVKRMPRVHPRCGTNIMAASMVFMAVLQILPALSIGLGTGDSAVVGVLVALFTWRGLGSLLQQYCTTKPANHKQIVSGIAAAEDLQRKYLFTVPKRPSILRRIWCTGMLQMMVGSYIGATASFMLLSLVLH